MTHQPVVKVVAEVKAAAGRHALDNTKVFFV
jgi:hypothetical protein